MGERERTDMTLSHSDNKAFPQLLQLPREINLNSRKKLHISLGIKIYTGLRFKDWDRSTSGYESRAIGLNPISNTCAWKKTPLKVIDNS